MANVGVARDIVGNTTFFAYSIDKIVAHSTVILPSLAIIAQKYPNIPASHYINLVAGQLGKSVDYYAGEDNGTSFVIKHIGEPSLEEELNSNTGTAKDLIFMEFTAEEIQALQTLRDTNSLLVDFPMTLAFKRITPPEAYKHNIIKYEVYLEGFAINATSQELEVMSIATGLYQYKIVEAIDFSIHPLLLKGSGNSEDVMDLPIDYPV